MSNQINKDIQRDKYGEAPKYTSLSQAVKEYQRKKLSQYFTAAGKDEDYPFEDIDFEIIEPKQLPDKQ
jgi:hypothetical protein